MTDAKLKALCDSTVELAVERMHEAGAGAPMILDRLLTYAAAQACARNGSPFTADLFREMAQRIDAGIFHHVTGEDELATLVATRKH